MTMTATLSILSLAQKNSLFDGYTAGITGRDYGDRRDYGGITVTVAITPNLLKN